MTQLILTLPHEQDADWLVPMLARLGVQARPLKLNSPQTEAEHRAIIEAGGEDKEDFDAYLAEFEKSRQDRILPFRE